MSLDLSSAIASLKTAEAASPGFMASLVAGIDNVEHNVVLNGLLTSLNANFAGEEQKILEELKTLANGLLKAGTNALPFVEKLVTAGASVAQYLPQLVALFQSLKPKAA